MMVCNQVAVSQSGIEKALLPQIGEGLKEYRSVYSVSICCIHLFAVLGLMESAAPISRTVAFWCVVPSRCYSHLLR